MKHLRVPIGFLNIEAIMDESGDYFVTVKSVANLFALDKDLASKVIKEQYKSVLDHEEVIPLDHLITVAMYRSGQGHKPAKEYLCNLHSLGLIQLISDSFDRRFDRQDRQNYVKTCQLENLYKD